MADEGTELSNKIDEMKEKGQVVFRHLASNALRRVTLGLMDYNALKADLEKQPEEVPNTTRMYEHPGNAWSDPSCSGNHFRTWPTSWLGQDLSW